MDLECLPIHRLSHTQGKTPLVHISVLEVKIQFGVGVL